MISFLAVMCCPKGKLEKTEVFLVTFMTQCHSWAVNLHQASLEMKKAWVLVVMFSSERIKSNFLCKEKGNNLY